MSYLLLLPPDNREAALNKIADQFPRYEKKITDAEPIFSLDGRKLEEIMKTLPSYQSSYEQTYQELKAAEEWLNNEKDKVTAKLWKKYNEGHSRALSTRDIQAYIAGEKDIVELNQFIIEVVLLKNKFSSIVEALKQMGWMVGHITKLRVSELNEVII